MSLLLRAFLFVLFVLPAVVFTISSPLVLQNNGQGSNTFSNILVPVTLGVMSKCPDAVLWWVYLTRQLNIQTRLIFIGSENTFDQVLPKVMDKVELSLTYLGQ